MFAFLFQNYKKSYEIVAAVNKSWKLEEHSTVNKSLRSTYTLVSKPIFPDEMDAC